MCIRNSNCGNARAVSRAENVFTAKRALIRRWKIENIRTHRATLHRWLECVKKGVIFKIIVDRALLVVNSLHFVILIYYSREVWGRMKCVNFVRVYTSGITIDRTRFEW